MSWDFSTHIAVDGEMVTCQDAGNMTWNVGEMYYLCLAELDNEDKGLTARWHEKPASEVLPQVEHIIKTMKDNPKRFKELDDPLGWGTYENALQWMKDIRIAILTSPASAIVHCV